MITNTLPVSVVSAIVARFDPDFDTLRFHGNEVHVRIHEFTYNNDSWTVTATHISGVEMIIVVDANLQVSFEVKNE